ncbi:hypothetical protein ACRDU6_18350 [Mycolicibacterium sp. ELW1]|nr:hypothetical protein [Mycobacterium sp. ELW1]
MAVGSPSEVVIAPWFWQAVIPESAGVVPVGLLSDWSLSGEPDPSWSAF